MGIPLITGVNFYLLLRCDDILYQVLVPLRGKTCGTLNSQWLKSIWQYDHHLL